MRRLIGAAALGLALAVTGCGDAAGPEQHSLLGRWRSAEPGGATVEMALSETARSVVGAGRWSEGDSTVAFEVGGTNTGQSVSLLFDFGTSPRLNFLGEFAGEDLLEGTIAGAGFPARAMTFARIEDDD